MRAADSVKLAGIGVAAGFMGALFGVGGGIVIVPLLVALVGFQPRRAAATSLAAILVSSIAGAATYALHGDVKPGAAALVGLPAMVGVLSGVALQQRLAQRTLTLGFALLIAAVGVRLLV
ncbi:MAG TPA: sulfite exporter TauE/SafE family protein [Gaiellaceae bacterium]|nr:sulfite exporter TauE/SafE family protein [Gaiellaceae bacterium]